MISMTWESMRPHDVVKRSFHLSRYSTHGDANTFMSCVRLTASTTSRSQRPRRRHRPTRPSTQLERRSSREPPARGRERQRRRLLALSPLPRPPLRLQAADLGPLSLLKRKRRLRGVGTRRRRRRIERGRLRGGARAAGSDSESAGRARSALAWLTQASGVGCGRAARDVGLPSRPRGCQRCRQGIAARPMARNAQFRWRPGDHVRAQCSAV